MSLIQQQELSLLQLYYISSRSCPSYSCTTSAAGAVPLTAVLYQQQELSLLQLYSYSCNILLLPYVPLTAVYVSRIQLTTHAPSYTHRKADVPPAAAAAETDLLGNIFSDSSAS
jgi:hypothetical protein